MILIFINLLGTAVIFLPSIATNFAKADSWITMVITVVIGCFVICWYTTLFIEGGKQNFFVIIEQGFGRKGGFIFGFLFLSYVFLNAVANLITIGDFVSVQVLMGTPSKVITFIVLCTAVVGVRYGLEVIARSAEFFFSFIVISIILLFLFVSPKIDIQNVFPVFQMNQASTFVGIIPILTLTYLELIIFLGIMEQVSNKEKLMRGYLIGGIMGGIVIFVVTFLCICVLGVDATIRQTYPIYVLGQKISLADFIQRIEGIVAFIWFFTNFFKICISYIVLAKGLQHFFRFKSYKIFIVPLAFLIFYAAYEGFKNSYYIPEFINSTYVVISYIIAVIIPLLLHLSLIIKKLKR